MKLTSSGLPMPAASQAQAAQGVLRGVRAQALLVRLFGPAGKPPTWLWAQVARSRSSWRLARSRTAAWGA